MKQAKQLATNLALLPVVCAVCVVSLVIWSVANVEWKLNEGEKR